MNLKTRGLTILCFFILLFIAFFFVYFSWIPTSSMSSSSLLPTWLANWLDLESMMNIRTAIPMVGWGLISCIYLKLNRSFIYTVFLSFLSAFILLSIAEVGQYFIPTRHADPSDIAWGLIGNSVGIFIYYITRSLFSLV